jgi:hypothetical protein
MVIEFFEQDKRLPIQIKFNGSTQKFTRAAAIELHKKLGQLVEEKFTSTNNARPKRSKQRIGRARTVVCNL